MNKRHTYSIRLDWVGNQGSGTSSYRAYSRSHEISAPGKPTIAGSSDPVAALKAYEDRRLQPTANVVLTNRTNPPDAILREVFLRTGDKPFRNIDDVISHDELAALSERYQRVAGFHKESLQPAEKA